jgi:hypothetical protein
MNNPTYRAEYMTDDERWYAFGEYRPSLHSAVHDARYAPIPSDAAVEGGEYVVRIAEYDREGEYIDDADVIIVREH